MPRPLWTGSLSFGLVNVPVELRSAVRDRQLHFTQLNERTSSPIEVHRYCTKEDVEVEWDDVAHGYELDDGREVVLTDDELAAAAPRRTRTIDVEQFADLDQLDPAYLDHPYVLVPASGSEGTVRAYMLLHGVMRDREKVAIGRFVLRSKLYLAAIRPDGPLLSLSTMRFHDELRPASGAGAPSGRAHRPKPRALREAVRLIESMSGEFDPAHWSDRHRARLRRAIERKAKGETIAAPRRDQRSERASPDLMEALEASIRGLAKT
ncbi:Ku protein [Conexibacter sp. CPCC 206217]|uniref:non-homologous end joining protein Ku n=1 Tax=Conexibacter sp. CPCC 206217 TaxID=3064574 RepID=UPI002717E313|nr:Ku protein [Conexibacter sp. CPCC 206217]MDO8211789.1 Ku protein [Conexibacter sp. CPCC 206217]